MEENERKATAPSKHPSTSLAATLKPEIVTPEGMPCSEEVEMVTLPGREGELGVYPHHVPVVTQIVPGEVSFLKDGEEHFLAVGPGFVQITGDAVSVITDMAIDADDLDSAKAEEARQAAVKRLEERLGDAEAATVNAAILRSVDKLRTELTVRRRRRR